MVDRSPVYLPEAGAPYYSTLWIQSIMRNCRINKTSHMISEPGKHTVRIFAAHPGMMIQKIRDRLRRYEVFLYGSPTDQSRS